MWMFLVVAVLMVLGYWMLSRPHSYWIKRGVPQLKPVFIFGDMWPLFLRKLSAPEMTQAMYNSGQNLRQVQLVL